MTVSRWTEVTLQTEVYFCSIDSRHTEPHMARIGLKNFMTDSLQLPLHHSLDYTSLHAFTLHLSTSTPLSSIQWKELAFKYFDFSADVAQVYFDMFVMYGENGDLSAIEWVLMLYDQLIPTQTSNIPKSSKGTLKSTKCTISNYHESIKNGKHPTAQLPASVISGRRKTTEFWRETALRWMALVIIIVPIDSGNGKYSNSNDKSITLKYLMVLDSFFIGLPSSNKSNPESFSTLLFKFFSSPTASMEKIAKWISVALDLDASFSILNTSLTGLCFQPLIQNRYLNSISESTTLTHLTPEDFCNPVGKV